VTSDFTNTASVTAQEIGGGRTVSDNDDSKVTTEEVQAVEVCTGINFTSERSATESLTITGSCEGTGDEDFIFEVFK